MPRLVGDRLVIATHNPGKLAEMAGLLAPHGVEAVSAGALGLPEPEEIGASFAENAALKAGAAARASGLPALADDSGLCVDALGGRPGLLSARWAGPAKDFAAAMARVEEELGRRGAASPAARRAHFMSVLAVAWPDGHQELFEGRVDGTLVWPPRGEQGFGYDPMFQPDGLALTFGELDAAAKHGIDRSGPRPRALSHRARAFLCLAAACLPPRAEQAPSERRSGATPPGAASAA